MGPVPGGIAIDGSNNVWLTVGSPDSNANSVLEISGSGSSATYTQFTGAAIDYAGAIAIDGAGNPWVTNHSNSVVKITGSAASPTYTTFAGRQSFQSLLYRNRRLQQSMGREQSYRPDHPDHGHEHHRELHQLHRRRPRRTHLPSPSTAPATPGSPTPTAMPFSRSLAPAHPPHTIADSSGIPGALAIDGSGDVWAVTANSSVVEMIGAAVPVVTPISAGSSTVAGKLAVRP